MSTIVTRADKDAPLTNTEVDANFTNLNDDKVEKSGDTLTGDLAFGDNVKATFGASNDLEIYHDGSSSYITEQGTGNLRISGTNLNLQSTAGDIYLRGINNAEVDIRYDNAIKLATTSSGVDVTGTLVADGLTVDGDVLLDKTETGANKVLINAASGNNSRLVFCEGASATEKYNIGFQSSDASFTIYHSASNAMRLTLLNNGHINFFEDTGTTAKLTWDASTEELQFKDNVKAEFGDGGDLQILHNGTNNSINGFTGQLQIANYANDNDVRILTDDGSGGATDYFKAQGSTGEVQLYHYGSEKLATKSTGIDVTGTVTADGLTVSQATSPTITINDTDSVLPLTITQDGVNASILLGSAGALTLGVTNNSSSDALNFQTKTTTRLKIADTGDISFYEDTGTSRDFFWDASTSRLGLGTTSPGADIHVSKAVPNIRWADSGASGVNQIYQSGSSFVLDCDPTNLDASSKIIFKVDNSEQMRIDSSGRLGIGTTAPLSDIHIAKSAPIIRMQDTDNDSYAMIMYNTASGGLLLRSDENQATGTTGSNIIFETDSSEAMRIGSSGRLGIGTTAPSQHLEVSGSGAQWARVVSTDASGAGLKLRSGGSSDMNIQDDVGVLKFSRGSTEQMQIDSSGNLLVGTTDNSPENNSSGTSADDGIALMNAGYISACNYGAASLFLNRTSTDGAIVDFRKDGTTIGDMGSKDSDLYIRNGGVGLRFNDGSVSLMPAGSNGNSQDGTVFLGTSGARFKDLFLSGGVYLGGTGSANLLDDYEEGAWTPTLAFGGASTGITYTSRDGHYIKIGKQVTLHGSIILSSKGSSTGGATVESLPFTVGDNLSGTTLEAGGIVSYSEDFTGTIAVGGNSVSATNGTTQLKLKELQQTTTQTSDLADFHFQNTTSFRFSITYFT
jgi:hypothetical protein